ncbi:alpha-N-acetylglucosaminidase TIM-barrel domain-containing protein [Streptomyces sp. NPDC050418]|uniref:alpha-N-acetylglucosaminidase n=1 Tax=Streptomyces sp. NPDC050418 TaxID=3365612 RepID=UPI00379D0F8D
MTGPSRRRLLTGAAALGGALLVLPSPGASAAARQAASPEAAAGVLRRLLPRHHRQVTLRAPAGDGDSFRVSGSTGRIVVEGTSPAVQLAGFHTYLRRVALASVSWNGDQLNLPERLPAPPGTLTGTAGVPHRYVFNDTNDGYTGPYRDWDAWQRTLDVVAMHGVSAVQTTTGAEAVYFDTFRQFGYSEKELLTWIPAPAHQPWWLLQNMSHFGGPVSRGLLEGRAELGRKITDRIRELGMTPVLPGYFGTVPDDFPQHHAGAEVVPQGTWGAFKRPDWLDPRTKAFDEVADVFYGRLDERLGASSMYKMDLLHEGGQAGDVPVGEAARAVESALQRSRPGAVWAILGWQTNPRKEIVEAIDSSRMLVVDGLSDRYTSVTDRERDWLGTPYAYGAIWNFGGHTALGANTPDWVETYPAWRDKDGSALAGIAAMPEAADNNPAAFALLNDLAWTPGRIDLEDWFTEWSDARYGGRDPHARAAWQVLRTTAYGMTRKDSWSEAPDGLFGARPSLTADKAAAWSPAADRYDTTAFDRALTELLAVDEDLRDSDAYRHDVMDVARQVLSNRSRVLLPQIKAAYEAGDRRLLRTLTDTWVQWMELLDRLLATSRGHLLGPWLADARAWGADRAESDRLEYDARSLITTWGGRASAEEGLHDYANREWSGLVGGLYLQRWKTFFAELHTALDEDRAPEPVDWFALEDAWAHAHEPHPVDPSGSARTLARRVRDLLAGSAHQAMVAVRATSGSVGENSPVTVEVTFTNRNGFTAASDVEVTLDVPAGLRAESDGPTRTASVASGASFTARFEVSLTGPPAELISRVRAMVAHRTGRARGKAVGSVRLMAGSGVQAPLRTVSFNDAVFGQSGDSLAIDGAGADLWGATNEFGAVHRPGALVSGASATVRVVSQDHTGGWARAGLIVRDDLTRQGSAGYVNLAVTPSNGIVLTWDKDGDGRFDSIKTAAAGAAAPVHLRITRDGDTYTGSYSLDGTTWDTVGTATPAAGAAAQDVGAFMTAANGWTDRRGIVTFEGLAVTSG